MARSLLLIGALLILFGVAAIFSVSIHESFALTLQLIAKGTLSGDPSNYFYFFRQLTNIAVALVVALIVYKIPLKLFKDHGMVFAIAVFVFLFQLAVFLPEPIGATFNGARGWIKIGGITTLQPAEFFKLGYVIFLASWLIRKSKDVNSSDFFGKFVIINALLFFVFLLIPDLGTVLVLGLTGMVMAWYAGSRFKHLLVLSLGGLFAISLIALIIGKTTDKFDYIGKRMTYFLSQDVDPESRQIGWQNQQALMAVGGGGFWGQGYGKGLQKFGYIPEAQSDFIFSAFSEEIGFFGNLILLGLYGALCVIFILHIVKNRDKHIKLIGVGIISLIIIQVFVNIGVNLMILPNTGLTLPFVSYGGSAIMINAIEIVLLYKIAKQSEEKVLGV